MSEVNLFELATRKQWRFDSVKGQLTVEDLWEIPLAKGSFCLDAVTINLGRDLKASAEESYVKTPRPGATELAKKLELLKHIIAVRIQEVKDAEGAVAKKALKQKIAAIREKKGDEALENMSEAELAALEAEL